MDNRPVVNIGEQRFYRLREENRFYIDKTSFLMEWWECGSTVTLITRPRRFGKTLNMSMTECFFSNKYAGRSDLFEGLTIWEAKSSAGKYTYRHLQGTFPVIFLSFASIKAVDRADMIYKMSKVIADLYDENTYLLSAITLTLSNLRYTNRRRNGIWKKRLQTLTHRSLKNAMRRCLPRRTLRRSAS